MADTDIGNFILLQTDQNDEGEVTVAVHQTFWFPWKHVSAGDLVVIYSKSGTQSDKIIEGSSHKAHFFYWGLTRAIWNTEGRAAVLLYAPEWDSKGTKEL